MLAVQTDIDGGIDKQIDDYRQIGDWMAGWVERCTDNDGWVDGWMEKQPH